MKKEEKLEGFVKPGEHPLFKDKITTDKDRIAENAKKGYILVANIDGLELYKKENAASGWSYFGESCAVFGLIWDNCLGSKKEFIAIAKDCYNLELK